MEDILNEPEAPEIEESDDLDDEVQEPIKGKKGGYRVGAGRKAGSKNLVSIKKAILEYMSPQELKNLVNRLKKWAKTDKKVAMFLAEQVFGKAKTSGSMQVGGAVMHIGKMLDELESQKTIVLPKEQYYVGDPIPRPSTTGQNLEIEES